MRTIACAVTIVLGAATVAVCATTTPPPPEHPHVVEERTPETPKAEKWRSRSLDVTCENSLTALAAGELDTFKGIGKCGRVDAEMALGSSGDTPSKFEQFGEYRVYRSSKGSVLVWFISDDIRVAQILYPKLARPVDQLIGEPEAKVKSELSAEWDQWIYARRGLTLHVKRGTSEVVTLFAYKPTTVDEFLKTDIARVAKSEAPLEELK